MGPYWWAYWTVYNPDKARFDKFIWGWRWTEEDLRKDILQVYQGNFKTIQLETRDENKARGIINALLAQEQGSLEIAMERFRHRIGR